MLTEVVERPARVVAERKSLADQYAGMYCMLNGKVAKIVGRQNQFGTIAALNVGGESAEFAWETIQYVMSRLDGKFRT